MNKYRSLAQHLRTLLTTPRQLKSLIYSPSFGLNIPSSYSLLSTCLNNISHFRAFRDLVEEASGCQITSEYLFWVMLAEYINTGRIVGGGKIKRLIMDHIDRMPEELKKGKVRKVSKGRVQIRVSAATTI